MVGATVQMTLLASDDPITAPPTVNPVTTVFDDNALNSDDVHVGPE